MERGVITISETGVVTMPTAPVWMTKFEIADLLGVFSYDIRKAIHSIYKNKELEEVETRKYIKQPESISMIFITLKMIIAIAFRVCSKESVLLRQFVISKLVPPQKKHRLHCSFLVAEVTTYGIVEVHSVSHSLPMSDAKVAYGFDIRGKVRRRCRFGQNLPQTSLSIFNRKPCHCPSHD